MDTMNDIDDDWQSFLVGGDDTDNKSIPDPQSSIQMELFLNLHHCTYLQKQRFCL